MEIEEDAIEEIARLYGYDNIPGAGAACRADAAARVDSARLPSVFAVRQMLAPIAAIRKSSTLPFVEEPWEADFAGQRGRIIRLANPDRQPDGVMRSTLIGGLVSNLITNLKA